MLTDAPPALPAPALGAALRDNAHHHDNHIRAAVEIITGYSGGALLDMPLVRGYVQGAGTPATRIRWHALAEAVRRGPLDQFGLGRRTRYVLRLACDVATGATIRDLGTVAAQLDTPDRAVILTALATLLGQREHLDELVWRLTDAEGRLAEIRRRCQADDGGVSILNILDGHGLAVVDQRLVDSHAR